MDKRFVFSTLTLLLFNCVVIIVSLFSDYWVHKSEGIVTAYTGLFRGCGKVLEFKICQSIEDPFWVVSFPATQPIPSNYFKMPAPMKCTLHILDACSWNTAPIELEIVKGLVIAGLILSVVPVLFVFLKMFGCVSGSKWLNGGAFMLAVSGVFLTGGIVLYILRIYKNTDNDLHEDGFSLHVGFIFACVGVGVSFICAGLMKKMGPYMESETGNVAV